MAHTPTPWVMEVTHITTSQKPFVHIDHKRAEFEHVGICTLSLDGCVENAALIVKAVNAHDDLVDVLKYVLEWGMAGEEGCGTGYEAVRAALTKAGELK